MTIEPWTRSAFRFAGCLGSGGATWRSLFSHEHGDREVGDERSHRVCPWRDRSARAHVAPPAVRHLDDGVGVLRRSPQGESRHDDHDVAPAVGDRGHGVGGGHRDRLVGAERPVASAPEVEELAQQGLLGGSVAPVVGPARGGRPSGMAAQQRSVFGEVDGPSVVGIDERELPSVATLIGVGKPRQGAAQRGERKSVGLTGGGPSASPGRPRPRPAPARPRGRRAAWTRHLRSPDRGAASWCGPWPRGTTSGAPATDAPSAPATRRAPSATRTMRCPRPGRERTPPAPARGPPRRRGRRAPRPARRGAPERPRSASCRGSWSRASSGATPRRCPRPTGAPRRATPRSATDRDRPRPVRAAGRPGTARCPRRL